MSEGNKPRPVRRRTPQRRTLAAGVFVTCIVLSLLGFDWVERAVSHCILGLPETARHAILHKLEEGGLGSKAFWLRVLTLSNRRNDSESMLIACSSQISQLPDFQNEEFSKQCCQIYISRREAGIYHERVDRFLVGSAVELSKRIFQTTAGKQLYFCVAKKEENCTEMEYVVNSMLNFRYPDLLADDPECWIRLGMSPCRGCREVFLSYLKFVPNIFHDRNWLIVALLHLTQQLQTEAAVETCDNWWLNIGGALAKIVTQLSLVDRE